MDQVGLKSEERPTVSIILPTYDRAQFLPQAFQAISRQQLQSWELIVVDDGSTDNTRELVAALAGEFAQSVRYVYQANQGAYGARNTGLDLAQGEYIAFYDSDDVWLPHHLRDCVDAMEKEPEVDWAYGACRIVNFVTGLKLERSTMYVEGRPRPFLKLGTRRSENFRIFEDPRTLRCLLTHGLYCGLQNSVIRRRVFAERRFDVRFRNEGEDVLMAIRVMADGHRFGYFDNVHVIYHVHERNSSSAGAAGGLEKRLQIQRALILGLEHMFAEFRLAAPETRNLRRSISHAYFWQLGYSLLWENGRHQEALQMFRRGFRLWPWDFSYIITYLRCLTLANLPRKSNER